MGLRGSLYYWRVVVKISPGLHRLRLGVSLNSPRRSFMPRLVALAIAGSLIVASTSSPTAASTRDRSTGGIRVGTELATLSAKGAISFGQVAVLGTSIRRILWHRTRCGLRLSA